MTPTYNRAQLLPRAVDSVLGQTYRNLELIIVDDGSTDKTGQVLSDMRDERLRVLTQDHLGVSGARNLGAAVSRGGMIAFLDSDDLWQPQKLELQLRFMRLGGWEISQTDEIWIRKGERVNPKKKHAKKGGWLFEPSLELCLISPSAVMITRSCWEAIGPFDESLPACEDYDLWLRSSLHYPVGFLPQPLVVKYGGHPDQLSRKIIGLDLYRIYSLRNLLAREDLPLEKRRLAAANLRQRVARYAQGCLKRDKPEEARRVRDLVSGVLGLEEAARDKGAWTREVR